MRERARRTGGSRRAGRTALAVEVVLDLQTTAAATAKSATGARYRAGFLAAIPRPSYLALWTRSQHP